jgi:hypothetical protein
MRTTSLLPLRLLVNGPSSCAAPACAPPSPVLPAGDSVKRIVGELFGFGLGSEKGKGGSMHFYSKANKFWGGTGIVGAQIPVGVGAAFAELYKNKGVFPVPNIGVAMYGALFCWEAAGCGAPVWLRRSGARVASAAVHTLA